jgi:hypothetical protein
MMVRIEKSKYKDVDSIEISTSKLKAVFLPAFGGKMASFMEKVSKIEYLTQRGGSKYRVQPYGGNYLVGEGSGFDDMFPNIEQYYYDRFPWNGTLLPDHGEIWTLPASYELTDNSIIFTINGVKMPYVFCKKIYFNSETTICIDYTVKNLSPFELDYLWAAHLMLDSEEGARITVDPSFKTAFVTYCKSGRFGGYGARFNYPITTDIHGKSYDASIIRSREENEILKFYFLEKADTGLCMLHYYKRERVFRLRFDKENVPYLALLNNEGGSAEDWDMDYYNFYFELCTAPFDRPDIARKHDKYSSLKPYETRQWTISMEIDGIK